MKKNRRISKIAYGVLAIILLASLWILLREKPVRVEVASVVRGDFEEILRVDGAIKSKTKMTVVARATGDLGSVTLKAGTPVEKSEVITTFKWDILEAVKSPIKGVISKVYRESAGPIQRGEPIVDIIDPEDLHVEAEVLTPDTRKISVGAPVKISGIGNDEILEGLVTRISRAGFIKLSALGIEEEKTLVYIGIKNLPARSFGDNFHVELLISLSREHNVLKIPLGALFKNQKEWAVYTVVNKKAHLQNIAISNRNDTEALVSRGLKEGDKVVLFPGDEVSEGVSLDSN